MGQIRGGYITVRAGEILNLLTGFKEGLRPSAIRLYLSAHLEANKQIFHPDHQITIETLATRANLATRTAQEALRELEARNLLTLTSGEITFNTNLTPESEPYRQDLKTSPTRPVPIPKKFLETLAPHFKGSDIVGALAHLLRCLFIKNGDINETGFVKASLVTKLTGLCERAIRKARHWLKQIGFITEHAVKHSIITELGGCFKVTFTPHKEPQTAPLEPPLILSEYVENAPPPPVLSICTNNDLNNQYLGSSTVPPISGFCSQEIEEPTITNIKPENLRSLNALEALYSQAVERNWFPHTERQPLEFISAAVRAITTPARDEVRVFVSLVRRGFTAHITQAQEVRAQEKLSSYRRRHPEAFRPQNQSPPVSTQAPPSPMVIRAPVRRDPVKAQPRRLMETLTEVIQPLNLLAQLEAKLRAVSSASG